MADQWGIGERFASHLVEQGSDCVLAVAGDRYGKLDENRFLFRPAEPDDLREVLREAWQLGRPECRGVLHLSSLDAEPFARLTQESLSDAVTRECLTLVGVVKAIVQAGSAAPPRCWIVTRGAQAVVPRRQTPGVAQAPIWGLARVLAEEHPQLWGGLIDLDPEATLETAAQRVFQEVIRPEGEDQIAYRDGQRYVARLRHPQPALSHPIRWRVDGTYLISGGLGDLGLETAKWMVDCGARTIALLQRSGLPPRNHWAEATRNDARLARQVAAIRDLEARGAHVEILTADVTDRQQLTAALAALQATGQPPIRGVVHAAGMAEPLPMVDLDAAQLERAMGAKVTGTWLLHDLLAGERLDFFVCFSSGAALLGSPMLGGYAAANAFLDAMAHQRQASGQVATSINWGFWDEIGMIARSGRELGRQFVPQGMKAFSPGEGLAAMQQCLELGIPQRVVMPVDWAAWGDAHPRASRAPLLTDVFRGISRANVSDTVDNDAEHIGREALRAMRPHERQQTLVDFLTQQLAEVMRIPADQIDADQPLNTLGIDSLMTVELRNHVQARLGIVLPIANLLQDPTITQLVDLVEAAVTEDQQTLPQLKASAAAQQKNTTRETLENLEDLSDAEIDRMLNDMLN